MGPVKAAGLITAPHASIRNHSVRVVPEEPSNLSGRKKRERMPTYDHERSAHDTVEWTRRHREREDVQSRLSRWTRHQGGRGGL